jgi:glyoxylase-like metal-dependent hydrolase (beta-lactamase superfamily II)
MLMLESVRLNPLSSHARRIAPLSAWPKLTSTGIVSSILNGWWVICVAIKSAIHTLIIPTPWGGSVNALLIEDEPLTLVDTPPNWAASLTALEDQLAEHGYRIEDLERLVLTHQHIDHIGVAEIVATRSHAEVCALDEMAPWLADYDAQIAADNRFEHAIALRNGMPDELAAAHNAYTERLSAYGGGVEVTRRLAAGESLEFENRSWRVHHRPGHSPSDTVFHDEHSGELIGGDHLMKEQLSNSLMTRPLGDELGDAASRPHWLTIYMDSLRATRDMDLSMVIAGHGPPVDEPVALIDERLMKQERRAQKLEDMIAEEPRTGFDLAYAIWGELPIGEVYLALSSVLGHMDILVEAGHVIEQENNDGMVVLRTTK